MTLSYLWDVAFDNLCDVRIDKISFISFSQVDLVSLLNNKMLRHGFRIERAQRIGFCRHLISSYRQQSNNSGTYVFDRQAKLIQKERAAKW